MAQNNLLKHQNNKVIFSPIKYRTSGREMDHPTLHQAYNMHATVRVHTHAHPEAKTNEDIYLSISLQPNSKT